MKPQPECASCLLGWLNERIAVLGEEGAHSSTVNSLARMVSDRFGSTANVGSLANRTIRMAQGPIIELADHYEGIKKRNNRIASRLIPAAKNFIERGTSAREKFLRTCSLATLGNVAPLGPPDGGFEFQEVQDLIRDEGSTPDFSEEIYEAALAAESILYITDNAGEIGFDSLLIERLKKMGAKVTLVVKEEPFFEDATAKDAGFFSLDGLADDIISIGGFFVPDELSPPLRHAFKQSDLLVSKGTGNYEALQGEAKGKPTIHMLKVKCKPVARQTGGQMGTFLIGLER